MSGTTHDHETIEKVVHGLFDGRGDPTILEYIVGVLEDEHFEFGKDGEEAFDQIGPFLVRRLVCWYGSAVVTAEAAQIVIAGRLSTFSPCSWFTMHC